MGIDKKRPRGLAAQNAAKKKKVNDDAPDMNGAQTLVLNKEVEEGDDIGEVTALLESALEKAEQDPAAALQLLRGTVHESDRILRQWVVTDDAATPPPPFYLTYGSALYELGKLSEDEEFEPYLEAAEERLQSGLDGCETWKEEGSNALANRLRIALSKVWLAKAAGSLSEQDDEIPELATKALETIRKVFDSTDKLLSNTAIVELASIVQHHGDLYSDLSHKTPFREWAESQIRNVLEEEPEHIRALSELGLCRLAVANYWLEQEEQNDDDDEEEEVEARDNSAERTLEAQRAYDALVECKGYFQKAVGLVEKTKQINPQLLADLAETCLNVANLVQTEEEQEVLYADAVRHIQQAQSWAEKNQSTWILPDGLQMFLEEWTSTA